MDAPLDPDATYAAIEAALSGTARGRWFLDEHARRQRSADTQRLLLSLSRLDRAMRETAPTAAASLPSPADGKPKPEAPARPDARRPDPRLEALARLDALTDMEKLALFS